MPAVPANSHIDFVFQDNRGYKATVRVNGFSPDISADTSINSALYGGVAGLLTALQAASNAKIVKAGWGFDFDYAQEPSSETGVYELAIQKAELDGGDGAGGFQHMSIPAPKDGLFLTTASENLVVVDPASALVTALQAALAAGSVFATPRGGHPFQQFFGGQLIEGKPRVRRVLQGA